MSPATPEPANRDMDKVAGAGGRREGVKGVCLWAGERVRSGMKGGMMEPRRPAASPVGGHERAGCSGGVRQQGGEDATLPQGLMGVVFFFVLFWVFFFSFLVDISISRKQVVRSQRRSPFLQAN